MLSGEDGWKWGYVEQKNEAGHRFRALLHPYSLILIARQRGRKIAPARCHCERLSYWHITAPQDELSDRLHLLQRCGGNGYSDIADCLVHLFLDAFPF